MVGEGSDAILGVLCQAHRTHLVLSWEWPGIQSSWGDATVPTSPDMTLVHISFNEKSYIPKPLLTWQGKFLSTFQDHCYVPDLVRFRPCLGAGVGVTQKQAFCKATGPAHHRVTDEWRVYNVQKSCFFWWDTSAYHTCSMCLPWHISSLLSYIQADQTFDGILAWDQLIPSHFLGRHCVLLGVHNHCRIYIFTMFELAEGDRHQQVCSQHKVRLMSVRMACVGKYKCFITHEVVPVLVQNSIRKHSGPNLLSIVCSVIVASDQCVMTTPAISISTRTLTFVFFIIQVTFDDRINPSYAGPVDCLWRLFLCRGFWFYMWISWFRYQVVIIFMAQL